MKKCKLSINVDDEVLFSKEIDANGDWLDMQTPTMKFEGVVEFPPYDWRVVIIICYPDQPKRMVGDFFYFGNPNKMVEEMRAESEMIVDWGEGEKKCVLRDAQIVEWIETVFVELNIKNETND